MKRQYFFDLETRQYVKCTNSGQACPEGCGVTDQKPESSAMLFAASEDSWVEQGEGSKPVKEAPKKRTVIAYPEKVKGFTGRQIQAALMRAKGEKRQVLLAEKALRAAGE